MFKVNRDKALHLQYYFRRIKLMNSQIGKYVVIAGIVIVIIGIIIYFFSDKLNWIGRLPGDIRIEKDNFRFYFPITTMIIASILLTIIIQIIKRIS